jgi:hypothetical protein
MNRILDLATEVGISVEYLTNTKQLDMLERFAELIVRECAGIALREEHDPYECILKHFGIETVDSTMRNRSTYFGNNP